MIAITVNIDDFFEDFEVKKDEYRVRYNKELDDSIKNALLHSHVGSVIIVGSRLGGGKTTLTLKNLFTFMPSLTPLSFIFLSPTHRNSSNAIETLIKVYEEDWSGSGLEMDELKGKKHYCLDKDYLKYAGKLGMQVSAFCDLCSYKNTICEFWKKFRFLMNTSTSFRAVHAFLGNIVNVLIEKGHYTDIVIDENPKSTMFERIMITTKALQRYSKFLSSEMSDYKNEDRYKLLAHLVERLHVLMLYLDDRKKFEMILRSIYDKIVEDGLLSLETADLAIQSVSIVRDIVVRTRSTKGLPRRLALFETFSNIVRRTVDESKDYEFFKYSFEVTKNAVFLRYCDLSILQNKSVRTWILDATTSPVFYKQIFSDPFFDIKVIDDTSIIKNHFIVVQLNDAKYGMTSLARFDHEKNAWTPTEKFAEIFDLACRIIKKHEGKRILIVSRKSQGIMKMLKENLAERLEHVKIYAHDKPKFDEIDKQAIDDIKATSGVCLDYYSVSRGVNYYDGFDTCILFGGAFPNNETIKRESVISGMSKEVLVKTQTEDEMNQSWGRIRPGPESIVYVLSSIELGFVNEFNTFKCSRDEMKTFIENGFAVTKEKIEMFMADKDFLKHACLDQPLPPKYSSFRFLDKLMPTIKKTAEEIMESMREKVDENDTGVDLADLRETFSADVKDYLAIMEARGTVKSIAYKKTPTSRRMTTRIVPGGKEKTFDPFRVQCEKSVIDGKPKPNILNNIIYTTRFQLDNKANVTSILRKFGAVETDKENRNAVEMVLTELVTRGLFLVKQERNARIYSFNDLME